MVSAASELRSRSSACFRWLRFKDFSSATKKSHTVNSLDSNRYLSTIMLFCRTQRSNACPPTRRPQEKALPRFRWEPPLKISRYAVPEVRWSST